MTKQYYISVILFLLFLFYSPNLTGQGPFPGVLDVYTLGGGISEVRASLLANKGFVVLALAYYGFQDLPRTVPKYFDLEYFEEAITFLRQQPQVSGGRKSVPVLIKHLSIGVLI